MQNGNSMCKWKEWRWFLSVTQVLLDIFVRQEHVPLSDRMNSPLS